MGWVFFFSEPLRGPVHRAGVVIVLAQCGCR
jgi:hypothetical protein